MLAIRSHRNCGKWSQRSMTIILICSKLNLKVAQLKTRGFVPNSQAFTNESTEEAAPSPFVHVPPTVDNPIVASPPLRPVVICYRLKFNAPMALKLFLDTTIFMLLLPPSIFVKVLQVWLSYANKSWHTTRLAVISLSFVIDCEQPLNYSFTMVTDFGYATSVFLQGNFPGGQRAWMKLLVYPLHNCRLFSNRVHQWRPSCRSHGMNWRMRSKFF